MLEGTVQEDLLLAKMLVGGAPRWADAKSRQVHHVTTLLFRTERWTRFAGLQLAMRGHAVLARRRSIIVSAPWFLVATLATRIGVASEVLAIRWHTEREPRPKRRSGGSTAADSSRDSRHG